MREIECFLASSIQRGSNNDHQSQLIFSRMNIAPTARNERVHNRKPDKSEIRESQALITHHNSSSETQSETTAETSEWKQQASYAQISSIG